MAGGWGVGERGVSKIRKPFVREGYLRRAKRTSEEKSKVSAEVEEHAYFCSQHTYMRMIQDLQGIVHA